MNLNGASAIVIGGSRGIGPDIAGTLARDAERLETVRKESEGLGVPRCESGAGEGTRTLDPSAWEACWSGLIAKPVDSESSV